ncbi:MAG: hypothetical protein ACE5HB_09090 [Terriglobia bacterium]
MEQQSGQQDDDRRRSQRVRLAIPVTVSWKSKEGNTHTEQAQTEEVNAHGAVVLMTTALPLAATVQLTNTRTSQTARARVVALRSPADGKQRVAFELKVPTDTFWGIIIPAPT